MELTSDCCGCVERDQMLLWTLREY